MVWMVRVLLAIVATWLAAEVVVRTMVRRDEDGQEWVNATRVRPHHLPLARIEQDLARIRAGTAFLAYDPELGWAPRPGARSADGLRRVDGGGVRTDRETAAAPAPGVLRIAIFGDSFTFGDEVGQDETWGAALERGLAARGVAAEVLNFGVNAYGTDQAYLRWQRRGRRYEPAVVLLGFQSENALRNLNVFRPLYFAGSEVPLSKPRFVVRDGVLETVNLPTIPPERLLAVLRNLAAEPLLAHERFFGAHEPRWWMRDRVAAVAASVVTERRADPFHLDAEGRELALRIVDAFAAEARAAGAAFLLVHLPRREELTALAAGHDPWCAELLRELERRHPMAHPERAMPPLEDALFAPRGHYAAALNAVVGAALVDPVLSAADARPTLSARGPR